MEDWLERICAHGIWGAPLVVFILICGVLFAFRSKFAYLAGPRALKKAFSASSNGRLRPFEAFALTVGGKIGVGNIVGVYLAVQTGGPGALLWMTLFTLLGTAISYTECKTGAEFGGGPPVYLRAAGRKRSAAVFAVLMAVVMTVLMPAIQVNTAARTVSDQFGGSTAAAMLTGTVLAAGFFGCVCLGEEKTARFSARLLPPAAALYLLAAAVIIGANFRALPQALSLIWEGAFGARALASGAAFSALSVGFRRAMFSCEAGYGIAPYASAKAAGTPQEIGRVQGFSVVCDLAGCALTGIMMLVSEGNTVSATFASVLGRWGEVLLVVLLLLFAFSTLLCCGFTAGMGLSGGKRICVFVFMSGVMICSAAAAPALIWTLCDGVCGVLTAVNLAVLCKLTRKPAARKRGCLCAKPTEIRHIRP